MTKAVIDCPACGRKLCPPAGPAGQSVQCPKCEAIFEVETAEAPALGATLDPPALAGAPGSDPWLTLDDDDVSIPARGLPPPPRPLRAIPIAPSNAGPDSRRCVYCGEEVRPLLQRCPGCGQQLLGNVDLFPFRRDWEPHRASTILTLGVVSLCLAPTCVLSVVSLPLGVMAWIMAFVDLKKMEANVMNPAGRSSTKTGQVCGMLGTLVSTLWLLFCGYSFVA